MRKVVVVVGPPELWSPLCREHRGLAEFVCVSPVQAVPKDNADLSLFLIDLFHGRIDVLVATSPIAIEAMVVMAKKRKMLDRLRESSMKVELIAIGERASHCAKNHGLAVSSEASGSSIGSLVGHLNAKERRGTVALLRSDQDPPELVKELNDSGWKVEDVQVYSYLLDESEEMQSLIDRMEDGAVDAMVFPATAHMQAFLVQLQKRCGRDDALLMLEGIMVAALGKEVQECLTEYGIKVALFSEKAEPTELLRSIVDRLEL